MALENMGSAGLVQEAQQLADRGMKLGFDLLKALTYEIRQNPKR